MKLNDPGVTPHVIKLVQAKAADNSRWARTANYEFQRRIYQREAAELYATVREVLGVE